MATETDMDMRLKCWGCLQVLKSGPVWRPESSHKLLCNRCGESRLYGHSNSMVKQFDWDICMICLDTIPDLYFACQQRMPGTLKGHAMCLECFFAKASHSSGAEDCMSCPMCRSKMVDLTIAVHTVRAVVIPDDDQAHYVPKDVLAVRLNRKVGKEVNICWENTWERVDLMSVCDWKKTKGVVNSKEGYVEVQWKDSWIEFEALAKGSLKERAEELFEDKYGF